MCQLWWFAHFIYKIKWNNYIIIDIGSVATSPTSFPGSHFITNPCVIYYWISVDVLDFIITKNTILQDFREVYLSLGILWKQGCWASVHIPIGQLYFCFREKSIFCSSLNHFCFLILFLLLSYKEFPTYVGY